ncbi:hypothetical protein Ocin01_03670 [Orchesella cincta]|uniref:Uncharacterized protein n=1 Tax=Orchesella cincta TaxID=48709 RepID=A0A1D2NCP8_ORCCI|nr:hypothetical protein Ocin01_03670 [Orchesella cincta]
MYNMSCYQLQAKIIAVIEMVLSSIFLVLLGFAVVLVSTKRDEILENLRDINHEEYPHLKELLESSTMEQVSIFMVPIIYFMCEFALGIFLYRSADNNQYKRLRIWFIITVTLSLVGLVAYMGEIMRNPDFAGTSTIFIVNFVFTLYSLWVVHALIKEIKTHGVHHPVPYNAYSYKL